MSIERTNPITGTEAQRRWLQANAATIEAAEEGASIGAQELHTSVDGAGLKRVFRCHENIGRTYYLGTVANEAAMLALDSPLTSHACLPGDTCFRTDTQQIMRCISNYGASVGDWEVVSSSSSADPAGTAAAAVSAHNTSPDSHSDIRTLIDDRALIEHQHARTDLPWVTDPGAALLTAASASAQRTALGMTAWAVAPWTDGTTSDIPEGTQLYFTNARADARIAAQKGQAEGLAPLDAGGKVPTANLPDSIVGQVKFKGVWDAATNSPVLPSATTSMGHYYVTSVAGSYGGIDYGVGDWCISDGSTWGKVDNTDAVVSFNGRIGAILPIASDYAAHYLGLHAPAESCSGNSSTANFAKYPQFSEDAMEVENTDITQRISSGIYQGSAEYTSTTKGWPMNGEWTHLIAATHTNKGNNYSMQFAGAFFAQRFFVRSTGNNGAAPWAEIVTSVSAGTAIPDNGLSIAKTSGLQDALDIRGRAYPTIDFGGDMSDWTTGQFIAFLSDRGFFSSPAVSVRGSWSYASNRIISDTGCGRIHLAGALVEVFTGTVNEYMVRVTTAPDSIDGVTIAKSVFIYQNHGAGYAPGWFRIGSTTQAGFTGTKTINGVDYTYSNGILLQ